ncbi:hybrid sensor histidine kinase/response regulator [Maridesulfovibrio zosterae]|uniref:hybrid sensor histidine kinase/response regulator n=1 Tax=Maridesulfovibrio zosterae TaxID=82171 RepID=UPI0004056465|nr:response regulator [Maridesulfovibrio zosterae]
MTMSDKELKKRLLKAFRGESVERMRVLSSDFMRLEKGGNEQELLLLIESSYRELHSLKGAARAVGLGGVEKFCQSFESFFSVLKKNSLVPPKAISSSMLGWLDILDNILAQEDDSEAILQAPTPALALSQMKNFVDSPHLINDESEEDGIFSNTSTAESAVVNETEDLTPAALTEPDLELDSPILQENIETAEYTISTPSDKGVATGVNKVSSRQAMDDTVRLSSSFVTGLLLRTEELISSRNAQKARSREAVVLEDSLADSLKFFQNFYENKKKFLEDEELVFFADMEKRLEDFSRHLSSLSSSAQKAQWELSSKVDSLIGDFKDSMLLPFSSMLDVFPRMVRSLSAEQGKKCELEVSGENVRIDRRILEMLHDPLMHMIRNSIDHGIESQEYRAAAGKPSCGNISFSITHTDRDIVKIIYSDDGKGIDCDKLRTVAIQNGIVSREEAEQMDHRAVLDLVFVSGMSTSDIITDISGRGLGMAIVRDKVEALGGNVVVASPEGRGVRVIMNIPVALTSFRGIIVEAGGSIFVVPKAGVRKVLLVRQEDIGSAGGRETILFSGRPIPLIGLADILELTVTKAEKQSFPVFIMGKGRKAVAISTEELLGEQDVMAKSMRQILQRVRNVAGFSMIGSGRLVPILHAPDMVRTALSINSGVKVRSSSHQIGEKEVKTVLITEDSITSRMLLKNVLEAAGYNVVTAVDGLDGLNHIKQQLPDILVSDVEMPRMDGFTLTSEVRKMPQSANLPIVLVTSLGSQQDRERGVEVGADAYIIKSSFDQGNLLEVISRLIG